MDFRTPPQNADESCNKLINSLAMTPAECGSRLYQVSGFNSDEEDSSKRVD